jgi:tryptophan halogenase
MGKKKIAIVGSGNAGSIAALHYGFYGNELFDIDFYYDPNIPIERVGQGTILSVTQLFSRSLNMDWVNNPIKATFKSGIRYENWGKINHDFFHKFYLSEMSCHYVPSLLSQCVIESGYVNPIEKNIENPEEEIDADWIFDCRGKPKNDFKKNYIKLVNPINSVILSRKEGRDPDLIYTRCVATPDGWTFVIPNYDSVSYGYLYNNTITSKEEATNNFINMFDVVPDGDLSFDNYVAKNMWQGKRTILNGNRLGFIEPMEATSTGFYLNVLRFAWDHIVDEIPKEECNFTMYRSCKDIETFILWHYQNGSKFDTPFWEYAKSLKFNPDERFLECLNSSKDASYFELERYGKNVGCGSWYRYSYKQWYENVSTGN